AARVTLATRASPSAPPTCTCSEGRRWSAWPGGAGRPSLSSSSASPSRWGCCRLPAPPIRGTCRRTSPARPSISARTSCARSRRWGRNDPSSGALALELGPAVVEPGDLGPGLLEHGVALLQRDRIGGDGGILRRYSTGLGGRLRGPAGLPHPLPLALPPLAAALRAPSPPPP